ncbi:MAG: Glu-tRNA(Gln) amidotransferase GatDE subunit D [Candidatus Methanomethylicota archaeon]|uniref:Glutamyl-tRNA(Gln) amidotransferase subunit D n=1 Tax=Thermoproteota archaeon TaxID=2056631 RepID=A0A497EUP4_9CREN|nr:MAG: Glu-tRNA(Gln) amidotransferase GatDE subunit D [Candidatus Verstraetearchaeota archaeon]
MEELEGYRGSSLKAILEAGASIGDRVRIVSGNLIYEGILMPRAGVCDDKHIVIKLDNGYNIGVKITPNLKIQVLEKASKRKIGRIEAEMQISYKERLPTVSIISTGGTIASRVDYKTGAVYPALTAEDLYSAVPELGEIANIHAEVLFSIFSENMTCEHWAKIAETAAKRIEEGFNGVVIAHGTDTMGYTAAALSFALQKLPVPVILVGSQRSSDRPSSDAAINLTCAVITAGKAPFAEVAIVMHGSSSDDFCLAHRGTKVRKCHTSRRDAFQSINAKPLAIIKPTGEISILTKNYNPRRKDNYVEVKAKFDPKVALVKTYPGMTGEIIDTLIDKGYHGIVIEGTGLGHTPYSIFPSIKRAIEEGIAVVMTSQCLWGRINMNVYRTGVELLNMGVIPGEDMLPETALVKLMWTLAQTREPSEVRRIMLTNIAGEISPRTAHSYFLANPYEKVGG